MMPSLRERSRLCLVRHGAAGSAAVDRERSLTSLGRKEVEALLAEMVGIGISPDLILHSGYHRARQTAEILASLGSASPRQHASITPEDDPDILVAELSDFRGTTMIVSHLPFLPHLCEELLEPSSECPVFATGTAVMLEPLEMSRGRRVWRVEWQINGREAMLRRAR